MQPFELLIVVVIVFWNLVLSFLYFKSTPLYKKILRKSAIPTSDLKSLLSVVREHQDRLDRIVSELQLLKKSDLKNISGVGVVRFNPFNDSGSNQSFSIALIDKELNGIVLTSLHGRAGTRIYSKAIKLGEKEGFELSEEEKEALDIAKKRLV